MSTTNLFDLLANEFSVDDLRDLYRDKNRKDITGGALRNTLSKWHQQGLITDTERRGVYRKCEIMLKWRCICDVYAMYMRYICVIGVANVDTKRNNVMSQNGYPPFFIFPFFN